jgi:hypothetical protein
MVTYFNLHAPSSEGLLAHYLEGSQVKNEVIPCRISSEHLDGRRRVSDLALEVKHDKRDEQIIWPWIPETVVIHKRLLAEFKSRSITGYRLKPATVRFRDGGISRDYMELVVTGWAGTARPESGIQVVESCPACHWKKYSGWSDVEQLIDWTKWTGEDFFMLWPFANCVLITERVSEALLSLRAKSFELRGLQDVHPIIRESGFTVSRLSNFMPQDLAIKYGRPLGLE